MKNKKADILDVAKAARVSASTVSRSFNHPELVKPSTRKKIDNAVRRLGYIRNRAAQTIHGIRSGTVGLIVPTVDHAIFAELIQSFSEAIEKFGFTILLATHGYNLQREYALTRKMLEHRVDGVALVGTEHIPETYELLQQQAIPTILLWNYSSQSIFPSVGSNNFEAGRLIGEYVASLGHESIALVFPPLVGNDRAENRLRGVKAALQDHGIFVPENMHFVTPYSVSAAKSVTAEILSKETTQPTAIVCGNDVLAWGCLHAISKSGLSCPDDVSVAGIGDFKGSKEFDPPLTTVRIPAKKIGQSAAIHIASNITNPTSELNGQLFDPELVVRVTCTT